MREVCIQKVFLRILNRESKNLCKKMQSFLDPRFQFQDLSSLNQINLHWSSQNITSICIYILSLWHPNTNYQIIHSNHWSCGGGASYIYICIYIYMRSGPSSAYNICKHQGTLQWLQSRPGRGRLPYIYINLNIYI
jgi:hypothetical protein